MADTKPHPQRKLEMIHDILGSDLTDQEALKRIRAVLYDESEEDEPEEDDEEEKDDG